MLGIIAQRAAAGRHLVIFCSIPAAPAPPAHHQSHQCPTTLVILLFLNTTDQRPTHSSPGPQGVGGTSLPSQAVCSSRSTACVKPTVALSRQKNNMMKLKPPECMPLWALMHPSRMLHSSESNQERAPTYRWDSTTICKGQEARTSQMASVCNTSGVKTHSFVSS